MARRTFPEGIVSLDVFAERMGKRRVRRMRPDEPIVDGLPAQGKVLTVPYREKDPHPRICQQTACSDSADGPFIGTDLWCQRCTLSLSNTSQSGTKVDVPIFTTRPELPHPLSVCLTTSSGVIRIALRAAELCGERQLILPHPSAFLTPEELLFKPCFINHLRKPQFLTALTRASRVPYSLEAGEHPVSRPSGNYLAASTFLLPKHFSGFDTLVQSLQSPAVSEP